MDAVQSAGDRLGLLFDLGLAGESSVLSALEESGLMALGVVDGRLVVGLVELVCRNVSCLSLTLSYSLLA